MIYTDLIDRLEVSDIPPGQTTFDLSSYIPNGSIAGEYVEVRVRPVGAYWLPWVPVDGWNNITKTATVSRPFDLEFAQFRRMTPRLSLVLDPLDPDTRVSKKYVQVNADQGLFVAEDWAREFLFDPYVVMLPNPGDGPNELGLVQHTQNHYGPDADYTRKSWNFHFSGGYLDRSHVKAQVHLPTGWVSLLIDPSENDPLSPSAAPFRFVGDYQLWLDLATLGAPVDGLVIYRHTPRGVQVSTPDDTQRIRASNMEPSASHGVFVAVEIGEELAKRAPACECMEYYTTTLYPLDVRESFVASHVAFSGDGKLWGIADDTFYGAAATLQEGTLTGSVVFKTASMFWSGGTPDEVKATGATLEAGGSLTETIVFKTASMFWSGGTPDEVKATGATLEAGGSLPVVINYVVYNNFPAPDTFVGNPATLQTGTLA